MNRQEEKMDTGSPGYQDDFPALPTSSNPSGAQNVLAGFTKSADSKTCTSTVAGSGGGRTPESSRLTAEEQRAADKLSAWSTSGAGHPNANTPASGPWAKGGHHSRDTVHVTEEHHRSPSPTRFSHAQGGPSQHVQVGPSQHAQGGPSQHAQGGPSQHTPGSPSQHAQGGPSQHAPGSQSQPSRPAWVHEDRSESVVQKDLAGRQIVQDKQEWQEVLESANQFGNGQTKDNDGGPQVPVGDCSTRANDNPCPRRNEDLGGKGNNDQSEMDSEGKCETLNAGNGKYKTVEDVYMQANNSENPHIREYQKLDAASGGPSHGSGGFSHGSGGFSHGSGGPSHGSGGPSHGSGGPSHGSGGPSHGSGGPSHGSGGPSHGSGGPSHGSGGSSSPRSKGGHHSRDTGHATEDHRRSPSPLRYWLTPDGDTETEHFVLFWRRHSPFSQWHPCKFTVDNKTYNCAEQFMMHQKAGTGTIYTS